MVATNSDRPIDNSRIARIGMVTRELDRTASILGDATGTADCSGQHKTPGTIQGKRLAISDNRGDEGETAICRGRRERLAGVQSDGLEVDLGASSTYARTQRDPLTAVDYMAADGDRIECRVVGKRVDAGGALETTVENQIVSGQWRHVPRPVEWIRPEIVMRNVRNIDAGARPGAGGAEGCAASQANENRGQQYSFGFPHRGFGLRFTR